MTNQTGADLFSAWIKDTGRKLSWVAVKLHVNGDSVGLWCKGRRVPTQASRVAIETLTGGAVPASAWDVKQ